MRLVKTVIATAVAFWSLCFGAETLKPTLLKDGGSESAEKRVKKCENLMSKFRKHPNIGMIYRNFCMLKCNEMKDEWKEECDASSGSEFGFKLGSFKYETGNIFKVRFENTEGHEEPDPQVPPKIGKPYAKRMDNIGSRIAEYWHTLIPFITDVILAILTAAGNSNAYMGIKLIISASAVMLMHHQGNTVFYDLLLYGAMFLILSITNHFGPGERNALAAQIMAVGVIFASFVFDVIAQPVTLFFMAMLFVYSFKRSVTDLTSREATSFSFHLITIRGLINMIYVLRNMYSMWSFTGMVVMNVLSAILPVGNSRYYLINLIDAVSSILNWIYYSYGVDLSRYGYLFALVLCFGFIAIRAFLGYVSIRRIFQTNVEFKALSYGFYVYLVDMFSPLRLIGTVTVWNDWKPRSLMYDVAGTVMMMIEMVYAREFFVLRVVCVFLDFLIYDGAHIKVARMLTYRVSAPISAFPQKGSSPFFCLNTFSKFARNCVVVTGRNSANLVTKGCGFIMQHHGVPHLHTAEHVIRDIKDLRITNYKGEVFPIDVGNPTNIGKGDEDPVIVIPVIGHVDVPDLTIPYADTVAVPRYKMLVTLIDGFANAINKFQVSRNYDSWVASVNLKSGDSGSPVFVIDDNGVPAYAGAVSRGSFCELSGNIISALFSTRIVRGSPGSKEPNLTFQASMPNDIKIIETVNQIFAEERQDLAEMKKDPKKVDVEKRKARKEARRSKIIFVMQYSSIADKVLQDTLKAFDTDAVYRFNMDRSNLKVPSAMRVRFASAGLEQRFPPQPYVANIHPMSSSEEEEDNEGCDDSLLRAAEEWKAKWVRSSSPQ